jgi:integrase
LLAKNARQYVFEMRSKNLKVLTRVFEKQRKKAIEKTQNLKLELIHFHTYRHWKATMEYRKTRDILHVKHMLGHKNVNNKLRYIRYAQNLESNEDEWICKVAHNINEAHELIECGFEHVTNFGNKMLFRKRK